MRSLAENSDTHSDAIATGADRHSDAITSSADSHSDAIATSADSHSDAIATSAGQASLDFKTHRCWWLRGRCPQNAAVGCNTNNWAIRDLL